MMKLVLVGSWGHHVNVVLESAGMDLVRLVAAAPWGTEDPMAYLGKFPSAPPDLPVYDDYRRMLEEVEPDVVGVFMPLYRNAEVSIAAARAGAHVVSEKPLATTLDGLAALREAADAGGVRVAALMAMRAQPAFQTVRDLVLRGRIGEPLLATAQKSYPFAQRDDFYKKRETYGGSIVWQAIHAIDFVSYCTGKDYARVAAMQANVAHPTHAEMEDCGGIVFELAGGGHALISFDFLRPWGKAERRWGDDRLRIAGTEGIVEVVEEGTAVRLVTPDTVEDVPLAEGRDLFAEFISTIEGEGEGLISMDESFRTTEVALKARHAADTGQIVDL